MWCGNMWKTGRGVVTVHTRADVVSKEKEIFDEVIIPIKM